MARTSRRTLTALVGYINKACGYPLNASQWEPHRKAYARGYAIYANSPGDGVTRYQLHFYSGKGSGVQSDCSWSYSLGAAQFEGKLRAFLAGLDRETWGERDG